MDAETWMTSLLIIMFAVRPIYVQDSIFKMSSESPEQGLTNICAWISNYIHFFMWDVITLPWLNQRQDSREAFEPINFWRDGFIDLIITL